ncbi:MAG TPA: hypothetical protein VGO48_06265 [Conexibacter sp.]|jgi:hypothetical protein|nr:hypothetical protein [Conexibacter sp.]
MVLAAIAALALASANAGAAASSAWSFASVPGTGPAPAAHVLDVSCAGNRLCVALDDAGNALSSTLPLSTLGSWQWTPVSPGRALNDVSCTASGFCAAVGDDSWTATTSQPTGAGAAWSVKDLGLFSDSDQSGHSSDELLAVGCESASLCAAVSFSSARNLIVSLDPGASAPVWDSHSVGSIRSGELFSAVACPARSLCVAGGSYGKVATSTDAGAHWRRTYIEAPRARNGSLTPSIQDVSCPTTSFCAAVDDHRTVITSRAATGGASAWHRVRLHHRHWLTAISCASASLCVALDRRGHALASTRPAGPASGWKPLRIAQPISRVSCASNRLCLFVTRAGELIAGTRMA